MVNGPENSTRKPAVGSADWLLKQSNPQATAKVQQTVNSCTNDYAKMTPQERAAALKKIEAGVVKRNTEPTTAEKAKAEAQRYADGMKRDYQQSGGNLIKMAGKRIGDGFDTIDNYTVNNVKDPVKDLAKKVDAQLADGKSDGSLSVGEFAWNTAKGIGNIADFALSTRGLATAGAIASGVGIVTELAPAAAALAPLVTTSTAVFGTGMAGKGIYDYATANTDEEARKAAQGIGTGAFVASSSLLMAKSTLQAAQKAGVETRYTPEMNSFQALGENARVAFKGFKVATGISAPVVGAAIPKSATRFESKPNEVQSYVTTGKPDGIVYKEGGKLFVKNPWDENAPFAVSKGSVIMKYDDGTCAVCDPKLFAKSYIDGNGAYVNPSKMQAGVVGTYTKKAPGGFEIVPEGTKVVTLENGVKREVTVAPGQVKLYDVDGNAYVGGIGKSLLNRNLPVDAKSKEMFELLQSYENAAVTPGADKSLLHQQILNTIEGKEMTIPYTYRNNDGNLFPEVLDISNRPPSEQFMLKVATKGVKLISEADYDKYGQHTLSAIIDGQEVILSKHAWHDIQFGRYEKSVIEDGLNALLETKQ